jgi:dTDP-4-dehydrorhamnose 3,5-epimerase
MFGEVLYFALDIDKNSETYGELNTYQLSYTGQNQVVAGTRIAHGFYVLSDEAIMLYCTDTDYDPKKENTFSLIPYLKDIDLYNSDVMLSERDRNAKPFVKE